jgi:hypothetical protein
MQGLQPSIDTCYLTMRDKAACHYLHFSENINIVAQCFNYAKHVFPLSSLVHNLKAIQVANVLGVATNGSAATPTTFKQREAGAGVGVCNAITSVLLALLHKKNKEAAMSVINIERIFWRNPYTLSNRSDKRGGMRSLGLCLWIREN